MKDEQRPENNDAAQGNEANPRARGENPFDPTNAAAPPPPDIVIEN
jgi:hypothetical protein